MIKELHPCSQVVFDVWMVIWKILAAHLGYEGFIVDPIGNGNIKKNRRGEVSYHFFSRIADSQ